MPCHCNAALADDRRCKPTSRLDQAARASLCIPAGLSFAAPRRPVSTVFPVTIFRSATFEGKRLMFILSSQNNVCQHSEMQTLRVRSCGRGQHSFHRFRSKSHSRLGAALTTWIVLLRVALAMCHRGLYTLWDLSRRIFKVMQSDGCDASVDYSLHRGPTELLRLVRRAMLSCQLQEPVFASRSRDGLTSGSVHVHNSGTPTKLLGACASYPRPGYPPHMAPPPGSRSDVLEVEGREKSLGHSWVIPDGDKWQVIRLDLLATMGPLAIQATSCWEIHFESLGETMLLAALLALARLVSHPLECFAMATGFVAVVAPAAVRPPCTAPNRQQRRTCGW